MVSVLTKILKKNKTWDIPAFMEWLSNELGNNGLLTSRYIIAEGYTGCKSFQFFPERSQVYS